MNPDFTFVMHHVGARGGACGFALPPAFHADALNVLYEPDTDCLKQVEERISGTALKTMVLPYALGEKPGRAAFNFHLDPYTNSFRRVNPRYAGYSKFTQQTDYLYEETIKPLRQVELEVRTIDALARGNQPIPPPDFLLVDTEGTAYEVLAGARDSLNARTLAVSVEVEFQPFWDGEKLFGDTWRLMDELGFDLVAFPMLSGASPHRAPVGLRGREFLICGDALFLRRVDALPGADEDGRWVAANKLACLAFWLGYTEYGVKVLAAADGLTPRAESRAQAAKLSYMKFIADLRDAIAQTPARLPPLFNARYSAAAIQSRFEPSYAVTVAGLKGRIKAHLIAHPRLLAAVRAMRRTIAKTANAARNIVRNARQWGAPRHSAFERVFVKYGFAEIADVIRTRRLAEAPFAR